MTELQSTPRTFQKTDFYFTAVKPTPPGMELTMETAGCFVLTTEPPKLSLQDAENVLQSKGKTDDHTVVKMTVDVIVDK